MLNIYEKNEPSVRGHLKRLEELWTEAHPELPRVKGVTLSTRAQKLVGNNCGKSGKTQLEVPNKEPPNAVCDRGTDDPTLHSGGDNSLRGGDRSGPR